MSTIQLYLYARTDPEINQGSGCLRFQNGFFTEHFNIAAEFKVGVDRVLT